MSNHFVRLTGLDGTVITVRPDHIVAVVEYPDTDYANVHLSNGRYYEIPKGQVSFDCLVNHTAEAGVRVLK